jgi:hypothetical protein
MCSSSSTTAFCVLMRGLDREVLFLPEYDAHMLHLWMRNSQDYSLCLFRIYRAACNRSPDTPEIGGGGVRTAENEAPERGVSFAGQGLLKELGASAMTRRCFLCGTVGETARADTVNMAEFPLVESLFRTSG